MQDARECTPDGPGQCQQLVETTLACPGCQVRVTDTRGPDAIRMQWTKAGCTPPIFCPAIICVAPGVTADECMVLMTDQRVRHLPVMEGGRVVGVISIGDVVRAILDEQRSTIDALQSYIRTA